MIYWELFLSFLQVGLFSFGGGYAAMPLIRGQVVTVHHWLSMSEFTDLITISQMTPGPIAVNSATFVGTKIAGTLGALVATFGCILPSCIIVTVIARLYLKYRNMAALQGILNSLRPAVVAMIAAAGISILITAFWGNTGMISLVGTKWTLVVIFMILTSLEVTETDSYLTIGIGSPKCLYIFNKQSGVFESLQKEDKELLERPMEFNIWRAPTDNDRKIKEEWYNAHYNQSYSRAYETTYEEIEHKVIIHCVSAIVAPTVQRILNIKSDWEITCDGTIKVNMQVEKDMEFPMLPRFGIRLFMNRNFDDVEYFGIGPDESYIDKCRAGSHGTYTAKVDDLHEDYFWKPYLHTSQVEKSFLIVMTARLGNSHLTRKIKAGSRNAEQNLSRIR